MKKVVLTSLLGVVVLFAVLFGLQYLGLVNYKFFAPKYQNAQREVFENTKSFTEGKKQDLIKYYHEWIGSDKQGKKALKELVLDDFSNYDVSKLTPSEQNMYNKMAGE